MNLILIIMEIFKNSFLIITFLISFIFITSCEKNNDFDDASIDFENAFNNELYIVEKGNQIQIDKPSLSTMWKSNLEIEKTVNFDDFRIIKEKYSDTGDDYYMLKTISEDGRISIANILEMNNGKMTLGKKTCKCETNSCSWSGCEAKQSSSSCRCTPCQGDCKKTSTDSDEVSDDDGGNTTTDNENENEQDT